MSGGGGSGKIEETENERAQAEVAVKRWNDYQRHFKPYENKFMAEVDDINSSANSFRASELAISPLAKTFADEAVRMNQGFNSRGVNPNSGKSLSANSAIHRFQAGAEVDASSRATSSLQDNYATGLGNIVAMGNGQVGEAMQGMADIASMSQRNARSEAQDRLQSLDSTRSAVGLATGAATSYGLKTIEGKD
jgi:hypothetical protein